MNYFEEGQEVRDLTDAKVVCDSIGPNKIRLTTIEATYPLIVHNELMTHRVFSRNTASNRAIPVSRMLESVIYNPFIPQRWPKNQKGMQNAEWITDEAEIEEARNAWLDQRDSAVQAARHLMNLGVHKQIANRLLGPFLYTTAVITATEWANFFALRCHPAAQPEMQALAYKMWDAYRESRPVKLDEGEWHLPYVQEIEKGRFIEGRITSDEANLYALSGQEEKVRWACLVSVGRCAGVSYLRQGEEKVGAEAFGLALRLRSDRHWSPFEHVAQAMHERHRLWSGNLHGWRQLRKLFADENIESFEGAEGQL